MKLIVTKLLKSCSVRIIRKYKPEIVGVTGSVGKTTTKHAMKVVLSGRFDVRVSEKSLNTEIGVPLTIIGSESPGRNIFGWLAVFAKAFRLILIKDRAYPKKVILEMGADKKGDIDYLCDIAQPTIGVITTVSEVHLHQFKNKEGVAREKQRLVERLPRDGWALLNADSPRVLEMKEVTDAQVITYGFDDGADVQAIDVSLRYKEGGTFYDRMNGIGFKVIYDGSATPVILPKTVGFHHLYTALGAFGIGAVYGMNPLEIAERFLKLEPGPGRLRLLKGKNNSVILDDSYNASPIAVTKALETLCDLKDPKGNGHRRIAVLGDMLELGDVSEEAHAKIGEQLAGLPIDMLVAIGDEAAYIKKSAEKFGLSNECTKHFSSAKEAAEYLKDQIQEEDIILVKGSRGMKLEKLVEKIIDEPHRSKELLVS